MDKVAILQCYLHGFGPTIDGAVSSKRIIKDRKKMWEIRIQQQHSQKDLFIQLIAQIVISLAKMRKVFNK